MTLQHHRVVAEVLGAAARRPVEVLPLVLVVDSSPEELRLAGGLPEQVAELRPQPVELVLEELQRLVGLAFEPASELVEHQFGLVGLAFGLVGLASVPASLLAPVP